MRGVVPVARPGVLCCTLGVDAAVGNFGSGDLGSEDAGADDPGTTAPRASESFRRDGPPRLFRWRRRDTAGTPLPAARSYRSGDTVVIVTGSDFVCCTYKGCGTLRPLAEVATRTPCAGCGRV